MKNRSMMYWVREAFKIMGIAAGVSFLYALFMGYVSVDNQNVGSGLELVKNFVAGGLGYFCLMLLVFLARFSLDVAQRQIPLCISHGETRKDIVINQQLSVLIQLICSVAIINLLLFLVAPGTAFAQHYQLFYNNPLWTIAGSVLLCLMPLAVSQLTCALTILSEGRNATWINMGTMILVILLIMVFTFVGIAFLDNLAGNWTVILIMLSVTVVLYGGSFFWFRYLIKNYRVSL